MKIKTIEHFEEFCVLAHDYECNQKYGNGKPYSYHLEKVADTVTLFSHILSTTDDYVVAYCGAWGHDLIEDARVTYNDIKQGVNIIGENKKNLGGDIAEVIYSCTEEKGRNRNERHSDKFFSDLRENKIGMFIKICDIIANVTESKNTGHSMYKKYQKEYVNVKKQLYIDEYKELFDYLEKLLKH